MSGEGVGWAFLLGISNAVACRSECRKLGRPLVSPLVLLHSFIGQVLSPREFTE